ncbi:MAG TPA: DNA helicase RecQ [Gemmataceae bacterium]|nr:DNA helicase RecQ [Gemmataceae bacterium]
MQATRPTYSLEALRNVIERHWGYRTFKPLQEQGMRAVIEGRDSLLVLPTGGGKSLCYQAPAVLQGGTTVVVSPLISLMKDQVDSLRACGVAAIQMDSSQSSSERAIYERNVLDGSIRLLFVSPERLVIPEFCSFLQRTGVRAFAIDEAHCISHWGHDFRPEYRQLSRLKEDFPQASVHAYTATATTRVRQDITEQLRLKQPELLVGNFDRPNLSYRVLSRQDLMRQVLEVIERHPREAGIIYCIRRLDVDDLTAKLQKQGYKALPYHAGMLQENRRAAQEAFAAEQCDVVVATVAFGMGIHRSNLRYVLHTAMPKSLEHYQQETGRAGRDNLEAECVLLHSGADFLTWKFIIEKSANEAGASREFVASALGHLEDIDRYCRGAVCRHRALVQYFGQTYEPETCGACDLCLGDAEVVADALVVAQKILSCVARTKERFGIGHVVSVLRGEDSESVRKWQHEQLSTYGLLRECNKADVRDWIYQLVGQGCLGQEEIQLANGKMVPILKLNAASWEVMRKERTPRLVQPVRRKKSEKAPRSKADTISWEGVDRDLFEAMRDARRKLAEEKKLPPYVIFSDATLRELARVRPSSLERMRLVYGIGDAKLRDFGGQFLQIINEHSKERALTQDNPAGPLKTPEPRTTSARPNPQRDLAFQLFRKHKSIDEVVRQTYRSQNTVLDYLCEFIREERLTSIREWVVDDVYQRIADAIRQVGGTRLKPIFIALGEEVPYDAIRLVVAHLGASARAE